MTAVKFIASKHDKEQKNHQLSQHFSLVFVLCADALKKYSTHRQEGMSFNNTCLSTLGAHLLHLNETPSRSSYPHCHHFVLPLWLL